MKRWLPLLACLLALPGCPKPDHIELEPTELTFARRGEEVWVHAKFLDHTSHVYLKQPATWSSSDPKVAAVDNSEKPGNVTAKGPGHCTITVKGDDGIEAELSVTVSTVEKLKVEPAEVKLNEDGEKQPMSVTALDVGGHPLKGRTAHLKCQDEKVCNSDGDNVWPVGAGATILEVALDDQTVKVPVTVEKGKAKK
jgi:hypothetical protein